jgi:hypothetical protein
LKCDIGDIVLVNNFSYPDGTKGTLHSFVVMNIIQDKLTLVTLEYLCFIISSQISKNNDVNSNYPYNEPIPANEETGLQQNSHVKCDYMFENIKENDIIMRVGIVTDEQFEKFMKLYKLASK